MAENIAPDRNENIRVVVRGRPLSTEEINAGYDSIASFDGVQHTISLKDPNESAAVKSFTFDHVFGPECTQPDIFNQVARPIIDNVLEGYNGTIFAYGQTGSGM
jgi:kinesin family member 3A